MNMWCEYMCIFAISALLESVSQISRHQDQLEWGGLKQLSFFSFCWSLNVEVETSCPQNSGELVGVSSARSSGDGHVSMLGTPCLTCSIPCSRCCAPQFLCCHFAPHFLPPVVSWPSSTGSVFQCFLPSFNRGMVAFSLGVWLPFLWSTRGLQPPWS